MNLPTLTISKKFKKALIISGSVIAAGVLGILIFFLCVLWGAFGPIPTKEDLKQVQNHYASEIYSADGVLLGKYFRENRSEVNLADVSKKLIEALVATEDARFYDHNGVDTRSLFRVAFKSILLMDSGSGGGSTISQQLAKNLFPRKSYAFFSLAVNKIKEMIIAKRLERVYDKDQILTMYLNTVSFGENVYGVGVACKRFFNALPKDIPTEQAAALVGMLKATTSYNPRMYPERSLERRNVVLDQMVKYEYLTQPDGDSLKALPLGLDYQAQANSTGNAAYFRQEVARQLNQYFEKNPGKEGKTYNLYTDGLRIYTTIDSRLQAHAQAAVSKHMKSLQHSFNKHWAGKNLWAQDDPVILREMKRSPRYRSLKQQGKSAAEIQQHFETKMTMMVPSWDGMVEREFSPLDSIIYMQSYLHAGFLAMEPQSGHVRAWVGGIDYRHFQFDHVTSRRQVGSTFKPIVYAAAIENGFDPCEYIPNELTIYEDYDKWAPGNADKDYSGFYSMQGGLAHSVNTVSATVMMKLGVEKAAGFAEEFEFSNKIPHEPSLVLGTADLSLLDMVGAYSAFANQGLRTKPIYLIRVEDKDGNLVADFSADIEQKMVMRPETADIMVHMLTTVVDSGTAKRLRFKYNLRSQIGGKTGTTQEHSDGWFMGITPHLVCGVWVGGDDRRVHFRSLSLGQGANTALPIYGQFMNRVYKDPKFRHTRDYYFPEPSLATIEKLDCDLFTEELEKNRLERLQELLDLLERKRNRGKAREKKEIDWFENVFKKKQKERRRDF